MATKKEIELVKTLNLMDLVMETEVKYRKERDHIKMNCIFHSEKTPSMAIYEDHYYCFGCSANGDVISWAQQAFEVSFGEAVKILINHIKEQNEKSNQKS